MNKLNFIGGSTILFLFVASTVPAQQRQFLKYSFSSDVERSPIQTLSRTLNLSEIPPRDIKLPSLGREGALFTNWVSPMVSGGYVVILLTRSTRSDKYDILLIDSDADGDLTDEQSYKLNNSSIRNSRISRNRAYFGPVRVLLNSNQDSTSYHLRFELYEYNKRQRYLRVTSAGWWSGEIIVSDKTYFCTLFDYNVNGTFSDRPLVSTSSDRVILATTTGSSSHSVGKIIAIDGRFYGLDIAQNGASIAIFPPHQPLKMGLVTVPTEITYFSVSGENGLFNLVPEDGQARLPEGRYHLYSWAIECKSGGHDWKVQASRFGNEASFDVMPDTVVKLPIGEPLYSKLQIKEIVTPNRSRSRSSRTSTNRSSNNGMKQYSIKQELQGNLAQYISITRDGRRLEAPSLRIASTHSSYSETFQLKYG
jgi:hypothetical protein